MITMNTTTETTIHERLDILTGNLAKKRETLSGLLAEIDAETLAIRRRYAARMRKAYGEAAGAQAALHAEIQANPDQFEKPRTITLHGIKIGFQKGKGRLVIIDEAKSIALIRKHLPEQADTLINIVETVAKNTAVKLPAADLKRVGIAIEDATDEIVLKAVDSDLDKLIDRMLADIGKDEEGA